MMGGMLDGFWEDGHAPDIREEKSLRERKVSEETCGIA